MTTWFNDGFDDANLTLLTAHTSNSGGTWVQLIGNSPQIFTTVASKTLLGPGPGGGYAVSRTSDIAPNADVRIPFTLHHTGGTVAFMGVGGRVSGTGDATRGYFGIYNPGSGKLEIWKLSATGQFTGSALASSAAISIVPGDAPSGEFKVEGSTLTFTVGATTVTATDATITAAGYAGVTFNGDQGNGIFLDIVTPQDLAASAATAITLTGPTGGNVGVASANFTAGANGTITGTITVTPSDSGSGGTFTPASVTISSGTPTANFTYTPASNGAKSIAVTNNGGLTNPGAITYTAAAVGAPAAGVASFVSATATAISISATAASGGSGTLTYQWHRSTTANFAPSSGTALAGATALTLTDSASLSPDTPYYYVCRATDGSGLTADSNQVAGALKAATLKLGFIGDSITAGYGLSAGQDPATQIVPILKKTYKNRDVTVTNTAVPGSRTAQWVTGQAYLTTAKSAFAAAGVTHVHCMLGANDAAAATLVSPAAYKSNLQNIIADLVGAGYKIILSYPTYIPAGANSNATTAAGVALAQAYQAQIDALIDNATVLRGDTLAFNYFMDAPTEYQADNVHLTAAGSLSLATLWARAIDRSALDTTAAPALTTRTVSVTLGDSSGAATNLSGLKVAFHDEASPDMFTAARFKSATATTDASGVLTFSCGSTLASGASGHLTVLGAAGIHYNGSVVVA